MNPAHAFDDRDTPVAGSREPDRALPAGTRLRDYEITGVVRETDDGIVYAAWDASLRRKVALTEYMPASLAVRAAASAEVAPAAERHHDAFNAGLKGFVAEARMLARFDHASLVKVYRFWEENGTAYLVMPLYEGPTLAQALAELDHVPGETELRSWLRPVLDAVALLHDAGTCHQNIGPDNIVLTAMGPVLSGMGAARHAIADLHHAPAAALKPGFAAIEQYGTAAATTRGPWTDLYALAAVIYAAITGAPPAAAADRLAVDPVRPLSLVAAGLYSKRFLAAIDAALAVEPQRRPQDHRQFRALMGDIDAPEPVELAPPRDLMHEPFVAEPDAAREVTVPDHPLLALGAPGSHAPGARATPSAPAHAAATPRAGPPSRSGAEPAAPPSRPAEPIPPAWARSGAAVQRLFDKRRVYGLVAGTCALIGVGALALQYEARQAALPAAGLPFAAVPRPTASALPPPTALPAVSMTVDPGAVPAPSPPASASVVASATRVPTGLAPAAAPVPAAAPDASRPAGTQPASAATDDLRPPANAGERLARCTEILQKASLERITADETGFYKRECK